ncbi:MAG: hypothetical protein IJO43_00025 [Bacilli bacterium]|nr:hypothetical protein [Bacilli bacterium]
MRKSERFEMKLYEKLGVKGFQKLVFKLEKVIHFKDKKKNINYHIKNSSVDELKAFKKYLYYNGVIHVRNSIGLVGFLAFQQLFLSNWLLLYIVPSLTKNLYCVMLQRYNYLRIDRVIEQKQSRILKKAEKKKEDFIEENKEAIEKAKTNDNTLNQIQTLRKFLEGKEDAYLDASSVETLRLLRDFMQHQQPHNNFNEDKGAHVKKIGGR